MSTMISVGMGTCGLACGAQPVYDALVALAKGSDVTIRPVGCVGMCHNEVLLDVEKNGKKTTYGNVTPDIAAEIWAKHIQGGTVCEAYVVASPESGAGVYKGQMRIALRNCGYINPESLDEALARGVYDAARATITGGTTPEQVIDGMIASGLRGRGGAGFPTGMKWKFARAAKGDPKYLICNADEGDPGAFMDRSVLEGDPHSVIEGMIIGAFAIGSTEGYVYARAEYPLAIRNLKKAIADAEARGFLGNNIFGSTISFHLHVKEGAGAFVCGEETALIASIEGKRGMPRLRPPYPANSGLFGKPTNINNVETFANVPWILKNGAPAYAAIGTEKSKGTKVFALAGKIKYGGLVEVPMGVTLADVIMGIGGGSSSGKPIKGVQMGGPSGGCIPAEKFDTLVDYDALNATGAIMGSGGMVVLDASSCMVDVARFFLEFTQKESCGKCTFCRLGTKRMLEILTRICDGEGVPEDIDKLQELATTIKKASLCGLGQTAPNPVLTTLRYFRHEYEAHINDKRCPAGVCKKLIAYRIDAQKCVGCTACAKACPVTAIAGTAKKPHVVDEQKCVRCGMCVATCRFDAIRVE